MPLVTFSNESFCNRCSNEDPTPDLVAPYINDISVSSNELSPLNPVIVEAEMVDELSGFNCGSITFTKPSNQTLTVAFVEKSQSGKA